MDPSARHPPAHEAGGQVSHEACRAAQVEIGIPRHAQFGEYRSADAISGVEINAEPVAALRRTVADVTMSPVQQFESLRYLLGKGVLAAVAGSMQPPDLPG